MTDAGTDERDDRAPGGIGWRRLDRGLWVGRRDDRSVGTIEHIGHYVWIDSDGRPHAARRTLEEAQDDARSGTAPEPQCCAGTSVTRVLVATVLVVALIAVLWSVGWQLMQP